MIEGEKKNMQNLTVIKMVKVIKGGGSEKIGASINDIESECPQYCSRAIAKRQNYD